MKTMAVVRYMDIESVHEQIHLKIGLLAIAVASGVMVIEGKFQQQALFREDYRVGNQNRDVAGELRTIDVFTDQPPEGLGRPHTRAEALQRPRPGFARLHVYAT